MNKPACVAFACCIVFSIACKKQSFLDPIVTNDLNEETTFADSARTMDFLATIYTSIDLSFNPKRFDDRTGLSAACDEAEGPRNIGDNTYLQFASGSANPNNVKDDAWVKPWQMIRAANQLLKHLPGAKFSAAQRTRVKGETLFLRAWYYSLMLKHYGGVPIIGDTVYRSTDIISTQRNSYEECVNYIVAQCDEAESLLSAGYNQLDFGRITTGACKALKARVLLYAASPLVNDDRSTVAGPTPMDLAGSPDVKKCVGYPTYSRERWKLAYEAAEAVINTGLYRLHMADNVVSAENPAGIGFYRLFTNKINPEFILIRIDNDLTLERIFNPPSRGSLADMQGTYPYQEMADAFGMINGKPITDPSSQYDPSHPYDNRDPRFNYTITHNLTKKAEYSGTNLIGFNPILTYVNGGADAINKGTRTGYYVNKMVSDSAAANNFFTGPDRAFPLIRYAEILLNYAEAKNEYDETPTKEVYQKLIDLRKRAGILPGGGYYGLKQNMNKQEMRAAIQHERRIELAFEDHRFWDIRRWKIAPQTENKAFSGVEIIKQGNNYSYQKFVVRQHSFQTRNYFWPLPQGEVSKGGGILQNPGY